MVWNAQVAELVHDYVVEHPRAARAQPMDHPRTNSASPAQDRDVALESVTGAIGALRRTDRPAGPATSRSQVASARLLPAESLVYEAEHTRPTGLDSCRSNGDRGYSLWACLFERLGARTISLHCFAATRSV
jgi:hypothetical protein